MEPSTKGMVTVSQWLCSGWGALSLKLSSAEQALRFGREALKLSNTKLPLAQKLYS